MNLGLLFPKLLWKKVLIIFFFQKQADDLPYLMFQITHNLNWIVRKGSELESNIVSVERIREYSEIAGEVYKQVLFGW